MGIDDYRALVREGLKERVREVHCSGAEQYEEDIAQGARAVKRHLRGLCQGCSEGRWATTWRWVIADV